MQRERRAVLTACPGAGVGGPWLARPVFGAVRCKGGHCLPQVAVGGWLRGPHPGSHLWWLMQGQSGASSPDGSQPEAPQLLDSALTVEAVVPLLDKYPGPGPRPWVMTHGFPLVPPLPRLSHVESPPCKSPFLYFHSRPLHAPLRPEPTSSALPPPQVCTCLLLSQGGSVWWVHLFHQLPVGALCVGCTSSTSSRVGALC